MHQCMLPLGCSSCKTRKHGGGAVWFLAGRVFGSLGLGLGGWILNVLVFRGRWWWLLDLSPATAPGHAKEPSKKVNLQVQQVQFVLGMSSVMSPQHVNVPINLYWA